MDYQNGHVMTLANSIIGVSILAMPYCFKQCGILLSILILLVSSVISRLACHFLLKSAIIARRKTFEFLAFHIFGALGKFAIEIGMIGFLLGTCIAFFVVMGDLGPEIIAEMTGVRTGNAMRNSILVALGLFCVLPLGLLRNVDSLNGVSKATIGFYCCLVLKIVMEALPHIFTGDWTDAVVLWRPAGILQCLPIFSMALFCQTQLFEIYQALPNASLEKMNSLIRVAVNICTWVYIFVGTFGYIAFFKQPFTGNILLSFRPSIVSDVMKMGFVLSLAFSFPLVIFPCRASLHSLLYKGTSYTSLHESGTTNYISEGKFKLLTIIIVAVSLTIGILIPNIELVLGLVGSTIGVMICVLFPVTCFICISPKNTNERILAQIMLFVGVIVMVLGTYANLYAFEEVQLQTFTEKPAVLKIDVNNNLKDSVDIRVQELLLNNKADADVEKNVVDIPKTNENNDSNEIKPDGGKDKNGKNAAGKPKEDFSRDEPKEARLEPPQPEEPKEEKQVAKETRLEPPQPEAPKEEKPEVKEARHDAPQPHLLKEEVKEEVKEANRESVQPEKPKEEEKQVVKEVRREPPQPVEPKEEEKQEAKEVRREPPQPEEPKEENLHPTERVREKLELSQSEKITKLSLKELEETNPESLLGSEKSQQPKETDAKLPLEKELKPKSEQKIEGGIKPNVVLKSAKKKHDPSLTNLNSSDNNVVVVDINQAKDEQEKSTRANDEVAIEAIQKEESELKLQEKEKAKDAEYRNQVLIDTLQKQNEFQKEIVEQHKKLIKVIQNQQVNGNSNEINEEKMKAVREIENIAKKAIESISGQDNKPQAEIKDENAIQEKKVDSKVDISSEPVKAKAADPAPLSYQLGLNEEKNKERGNFQQDPAKMVPIPIALAKLNNVTKQSEVKQEEVQPEPALKQSEGVQIQQVEAQKVPAVQEEKKVSIQEEKKASNEDVNAMRRDILSEKSERVKRDVEEMSSVCEELAKTTEKPIIQKLCKLSEPDLVQVDFNRNELQLPNDAMLKPQKRDLK